MDGFFPKAPPSGCLLLGTLSLGSPATTLCVLRPRLGAQNGRVSMPAEVRGPWGTQWSCRAKLLSPGPKGNVSQVTWQRLDPSGDLQSVAAFHPSHGLSFPSPKFGKDRLSFHTMGVAKQGSDMRDATLVLQGLRVEDEGNFSCEFATFPWAPVPQNHAETQEVTLSSEPVPVARCVSSGGRPPAKISWLSPLHGEHKETETSGPLSGTVTVTSRYAVVPSSQVDGAKITCKVEHEALEKPALLPVTLAVRYPPEVSISGYDDNWYLGRSEATLNCDVRSNPEPTSYVWSTTSGSLPASAKDQGSQLLVHLVDRLVNTTFTCTVSNAEGTGRAEQVVLVRDGPRASPRDEGPMVWGAVGGTLLVLLLLAGGSLAYILLRMRRRRKSPGGAGGGPDSGQGSYDPKTQVFENGGPVFWTTTAPGPPRPDGKDTEEDYEEEEEKAEKGLMLPPSLALEDDMESQLDGSLISRRAVYSPNTSGAGATGGIIGGIIAAIIATAVVATGILICRQQRKEQRLQGAEEEDDLEGPPSYKPPTPKAKLEEPEMPSQLFTLGASEHSPLKTPYFDAGVSCAEQVGSREMPRYHELPTLEERSGPLLLGAMSLGSPILAPPGPPVVERVPLDLEDMDDDEEDYLDKINPIYDALSYASPSDSYSGKGFVMSRAMYAGGTGSGPFPEPYFPKSCLLGIKPAPPPPSFED
ncbi:hypothetical protein QTO34_010282 [Cnephaeus nilssonii]|uniref:Ig-like domain-containing protein n=1 Tax=Cnephaeus nilssonii TaxID=3371016 RepID=A0AA40HG68_CNENI|nr:hypothetical protein QTO34_010282 [Eptesicus nilssonii]